jgi:uncharacterized membrane protein YccF (DUF307 family)
MRLILNALWLVLCGFWMAIAYAAAGIIPTEQQDPGVA